MTGKGNYFKENITYSRITSAKTAFRYTANGSIPNMAGLALYPKGNIWYLLGWLNTSVVCELLSITNPTINFPPWTIGKLPVKIGTKHQNQVEKYAKENCEISKSDWDDFEISWDFIRHALLKGNNRGILFFDKFKEWSKKCENRFKKWKKMKKN